MIWKGVLSLTDKLPPAKKYPPVDLDQFVDLAVPKIKCLPILERLGFTQLSSQYKELKPFRPKKRGSLFYVITLSKNKRKVQFDLFPKAGGYFIIFISRPGGMASDGIEIGRYFELYDKDSEEQKCLKLRNYSGTFEEQVEQSLICINRILEERFEGVLKGDEWIDTPSTFYDYK